MFTGLVEKSAAVKRIEKTSKGSTIELDAYFDDLKTGDSVMINGACQTAVKIDKSFVIEAMNETLNLTNLAFLKTGDIVNLERAMPANGRFGGHFVSGHIDGMAKFLSVRKDGISNVLGFEYPDKYLIYKGSIAINGVSLTLSKVENNYFEVSIIPHTIENTNLKMLKAGDFVNIEVDILAKYIEKFCTKKNEINEEFLKKCGF